MFAIEVKDDVIRLVGDATIGSVAELRAALLRPPGPSGLPWTIDLSAATSIDSSAIQLLIAAKRATAIVQIVGLSAAEQQRWERLGVAPHLLAL